MTELESRIQIIDKLLNKMTDAEVLATIKHLYWREAQKQLLQNQVCQEEAKGA